VQKPEEVLVTVEGWKKAAGKVPAKAIVKLLFCFFCFFCFFFLFFLFFLFLAILPFYLFTKPKKPKIDKNLI